jgi:leader peptidase (prepilin peptidase)/N-methyltransferase
MQLTLETFNIFIASIVGLMVGSFLNVVIYRLPKMIKTDRTNEVALVQGKELAKADRFNLMVPRSSCPACGHKITALENIPIISYLLLKGKCAECGVRISARYPAVEIALGVAAGICTSKFGLTPTAVAWSLFCAALITLAMIHWDTMLLPDVITVPLLWIGLVASIMRWTPVGIEHSVWGAVGGYMSLWTIYWAFKLITGKENMGPGDFKLFAAMGAWFGWQGLVPLILLSLLAALVVATARKISSKSSKCSHLPFGPYLAGAGLIGMYMGPFGLLSFTLG